MWESFFVQIRSDTSEILDETIPLIKDKVMEMNHIYAKVDKLEVCSLHLKFYILLFLCFIG